MGGQSGVGASGRESARDGRRVPRLPSRLSAYVEAKDFDECISILPPMFSRRNKMRDCIFEDKIVSFSKQFIIFALNLKGPFAAF
jgi:hypothetical protein